MLACSLELRKPHAFSFFMISPPFEALCEVQGPTRTRTRVWPMACNGDVAAGWSSEPTDAEMCSTVGPWDPCLSIHERFPNAEGAALMSVFRKYYQVDKDCTLNWFMEGSEKPCLLRHPLNNRHQADTRRKYADLILKFGILTECRSEIVAMPGQAEGTYLFIAGATLVEAAYDAFLKQPSNPLKA